MIFRRCPTHGLYQDPHGCPLCREEHIAANLKAHKLDIIDRFLSNSSEVDLLQCDLCGKLIGYVYVCDMNGNYVICTDCHKNKIAPQDVNPAGIAHEWEDK